MVFVFWTHKWHVCFLFFFFNQTRCSCLSKCYQQQIWTGTREDRVVNEALASEGFLSPRVKKRSLGWTSSPTARLECRGLPGLTAKTSSCLLSTRSEPNAPTLTKKMREWHRDHGMLCSTNPLKPVVLSFGNPFQGKVAKACSKKRCWRSLDDATHSFAYYLFLVIIGTLSY